MKTKENKWIEIEPKKVRTFLLDTEDHAVHILKNLSDDYIVVHEDAYGQFTGDTYILTTEEIKNMYDINLVY